MSKIGKISLIVLSSGLFLGIHPVASAQTWRPGPYIGAGVGIADFEDDVRFGDIEDISLDDDDTAYKVFLGYRANRHLAIEGGYRDFGEGTAGPFTVETKGWDAYGVGIAPIGPVELFAKGGFIFWDTDVSGGIPGDDDVDLAWGVGGNLNLGPLFLRLEGEWFDIDFPDDVQAFMASVGYKF